VCGARRRGGGHGLRTVAAACPGGGGADRAVTALSYRARCRAASILTISGNASSDINTIVTRERPPADKI
jgi:hypothetical protein